MSYLTIPRKILSSINKYNREEKATHELTRQIVGSSRGIDAAAAAQIQQKQKLHITPGDLAHAWYVCVHSNYRNPLSQPSDLNLITHVVESIPRRMCLWENLGGRKFAWTRAQPSSSSSTGAGVLLSFLRFGRLCLELDMLLALSSGANSLTSSAPHSLSVSTSLSLWLQPRS